MPTLHVTAAPLASERMIDPSNRHRDSKPTHAVLSSQGRRRQEGEGRRQDTRAPGQRRTRGVGENPQTGPRGAEPRHRSVNTTHNSTQTWTRTPGDEEHKLNPNQTSGQVLTVCGKVKCKEVTGKQSFFLLCAKEPSLTLNDDNSSSECAYLFLLPLRSNRGLLN